MLRPGHIFLLRLTVQRQAFMVTITMDTNDTPPSKVKRMNDSKAESCKPGSNIGELNRQGNFKWLRKYAGKTASRLAGTGKTSVRKTRSDQMDTKGKLKPNTSFGTSEQVTTVQAPEAAAASLVKPLTWSTVVKNRLSMVAPQFQSAGFFSSFVPITTVNPGTVLKANYHVTNSESGSLLQANHNMTTPGPVVKLQANCHMTNAGSGLKMYASCHMTTSETGTKLQSNCHSTHQEHIAVLPANCQTTYSSLNSIPPSMTALSQLVTVQNLQPALSLSSNPQVLAAFSARNRPIQTLDAWGSQISNECPSQSSSVEIHLSAGGQTCPELTRTPRCWHTIRQSDAEVGSLEFTVMSYNILSQELLYRHMYLYDRCNESDLEWAKRGPALLTQIIAHNADIVCLQEVQQDHWNQDIKDTLAEQGYHGVYKKHEGDDEKPDGCAILFKVSKFRQLKFVPVEFMKGGILDRRNVGIILLLQPRQEIYGGNVKKMCVATTHLLFNPRRGDVKLAQLVLFLAEIDKHAYEQDDLSGKNLSTSDSDCTLLASSSNLSKGSQGSDGEDIPEALMRKEESHSRHLYCPIIVCGDFNSEPFSDLYKFITTGYLRYDQLVSRLVCGQKEGQQWGTNRTVDKILLPKRLSISETCQYITVLNKRQSTGDGATQHHRMNSGQVFHCMNFQSVYSHYVSLQGHHQKEVSSCHNNCSCTVDYIFYSSSKARQQQRDPAMDIQGSEASQFHEGCQSDSQQSMSSTAGGHKEADTFKEPLELLARYSLLTTKEVTKYGSMPNSVLPSDHLCLIARFLLR